jgi:hypothetical protein
MHTQQNVMWCAWYYLPAGSCAAAAAAVLSSAPTAACHFQCAPAKMGWHVQGMRAKYNGTVTFNGVVYHVDPETSYGYQDKNFGSDFTNPWYWISCNSFKGSENTSLVLGGGQPVLFGEPQGKKALIGFSHKGQMLYKWNFADIPAGQGADYVKQSIDVRQIGAGASANITWNISSEDPTNKVVINMTCPRSLMLRLRYENSAGFFNHKKLWNGAHVSGTVQLFTKGTVGANNAAWSLVDNLVCEGGAGEYGKF